jgi:hypothetical protein
MNRQTEALKLALEAIEACLSAGTEAEDQDASDKLCDAYTAIREALAEQPAQQQEPVAYMNPDDLEKMKRFGRGSVAWATPTDFCTQPVYTSPPASKPWVGLVWGELPEDGHSHDFLRGAAWAEAMLREKNA